MIKQKFLSQPIRLSCLKAFILFFAWGALGHSPLFATNHTSVQQGGSYQLMPEGYFEYPHVHGVQYGPSTAHWAFLNTAGYARNNSGYTFGNPDAPQGMQVLFLEGTGRAQQSLDFPAGYYRFRVSAAQRGVIQASSQTFALKVDGQNVQSFTPSDTTYETMTSDPVFLSSGNHSIALQGLNPNGGYNTVLIDAFMFMRLKEIPLTGFEQPEVANSNGFQYVPTGGPLSFGTGGGLSQNGTGFTGGNPVAPEGNQVAFLQGSGTVSVTVHVPEAGHHRFRFKAARRGNHPVGGATKQVHISISGTEIGEFKVPSTDYEEMVSLAIYLSAGNHTLTLQGVNPIGGDHTALVDDLRMEPLFDWHDPYVWGGTVPNANDIANVDSNSVVVMHGNIQVNRIVVKGQLIAGQNQDLDLNVKNVMVMGGMQGLFEMGQELAPYPGNATITLNASANDPEIMGMGNKFLGAMGGSTLSIHGREQQSWTRLAANADENSNQILLQDDVSWNVGDQIVVVSSHKDWKEAEPHTIAAIGGNGKLLTLSMPLQHDHVGAIKTYTNGAQTWTADLGAEVGRLSRNIKIQGDAASVTDGFGGHIMVMMNAKAYVSGVELYNMGQKSKLGRYPFHWHMLGDVGAGQYFKNSSVHQSFNRAITIHGTESTLVENNFCYDHIGHGVFLEDGSERFNVIRKNVVLLTKRPDPGDEVIPSDNQFDQEQNRTPASFWITNPQNTFEDNVAAGTQGTGYWFAFPTSPLGESGNDIRFSWMKPHELPLISFKGNTAHSCMNGFDIFDQLDSNDVILTNRGWNDSTLHYFDDCLWYANEVGIYSGGGVGGPEDNVIWRNNVFVENRKSTMLASYSKVENSVFVANSGENLLVGERHAYRVYDGAGQVLNSHFVGWNAANANLLKNTGASIKHPNHLLQGNTTDHSGSIRIALPDYNPESAQSMDYAPEHPRIWSVVMRDVDGGLTGKANTSLISNHPFLLTDSIYQDSNWTNVYRSDQHYVLSRLTFDLHPNDNPNLVCTRSKPGTSTEHVYYVEGFKDHPQLPFIVNDGFEYTYRFESLPSTRWLHMLMDDATVGDTYVARFKDFGKFSSISAYTNQETGIAYRSSLAALHQSTTSCFYREPNGDLWIKAVATRKLQRFSLNWAGDLDLPILDTDGDQMADGTEMSLDRHPFSAHDLAANFSADNDFEGWTGIANVAGATVANGMLSGTAINSGDAIFSNQDFNFKASEVLYLQVRLKANQITGVQIFFGTDSQPGYSPSRVLTTSYLDTTQFQTLTFHMAGHSNWNGTITDLRLDPVSGAGIDFQIDWIKASGTAKTISAEPLAEDFSTTVAVSPNPFGDRLEVALGEAGAYERLRLVDLQGRVLREEVISPSREQITLNFDQQTLSKGVYFLQLYGSKGVEQLRVVKH